jgi:hypothetical protein
VVELKCEYETDAEAWFKLLLEFDFNGLSFWLLLELDVIILMGCHLDYI